MPRGGPFKVKIAGKIFEAEDVSALAVQDMVFAPAEAERLLRHLKDNRIVILGGDILVESQGELRFSGDNWYSDGKDFSEAYDAAVAYLKKCKTWYKNDKYFVCIVF